MFLLIKDAKRHQDIYNFPMFLTAIIVLYRLHGSCKIVKIWTNPSTDILVFYIRVSQYLICSKKVGIIVIWGVYLEKVSKRYVFLVIA